MEQMGTQWICSRAKQGMWREPRNLQEEKAATPGGWRDQGETGGTQAQGGDTRGFSTEKTQLPGREQERHPGLALHPRHSTSHWANLSPAMQTQSMVVGLGGKPWIRGQQALLIRCRQQGEEIQLLEAVIRPSVQGENSVCQVL